MWEAVERSPGVYDEDYLDSISLLINKLGEAGIFVLVDAHQDVFARVICGEGMPDFYAKDLLEKDSSCINGLVDSLLQPFFNKHGFCWDFDARDYELDDYGDPKISDC